MTIKGKIIFWFLLPSILIVTITTVFCYFYTKKTVRQNIFDQLEIAADELQEYVLLFLHEKKARTIDYSSDGFIRDCTERSTVSGSRRKYYTDILSDHLKTNKKSLDPNILEILIVDLNGKIIASTEKENTGKDVLDEEYFSVVESFGVSAGSPAYDPRLKKTVINFSTVLLSKIGQEAIGVIVNRIDYGRWGGEKLDVPLLPQSDEIDYSQLIAVHKARIKDFSSDGFIKDCTEEITRKSYDSTQYFADRLNTHLCVNKLPLDPDVISIFVIGLTGKIISSTEIGLVGKDVSSETYFSSTLRNGFCVRDLHCSTGFVQNTFEVASLIFSKEGQKPVGIIVNRYNGNCLKKATRSGISEQDQWKLKGLGETGERYIVNRDKLMITASRFIENSILKQTVDTEGVRTAFDNRNGMIGIYPDYRGVPILGVSRYIKEMEWVVLAEKDVSEAFAPLAGLRNFTIAMGVASTVALALVSVFLSIGISRPIRKLVVGTKRLAKGDLTFRIESNSKDEIGELAASFNNMTSQLEESGKQLSDYAQNLERKVIVKTREIVHSEEKYRELFKTVTDGIVFISLDGDIIDCNKGFLDMTGYSIEEIRTKNYWYSITTEVCGGKDKIVKEQILERGSSDLYETKYIKKDSAVFPVSVRMWLKREGDGTVKGMWAIVRDITEHKRAEENMCKLNNAIEQAGEAVAITNRKGIIEYVNPAFEMITGYSKSEAIGRNPRVLKSGKQPGEFYKEMWKTITAGRIWKGTLVNKKKDGTFYDEEMTIAPVKSSAGAITHFVAIKRDITLQNKSKKQLVTKTKELEKVNSDLEDFIYITSHDLKEPLFVVEGYASRLSRYYKDDLNDKLKLYINKIKSNTNIMSQKINDIMEVLKVGKVEYNFKNNDSRVIVKDVIKMLESKIKSNETDVQIQDNLPVVSCDAKRLKDVFLNLTSNALKFIGNNNLSDSPFPHGRAVRTGIKACLPVGKGETVGGVRKVKIGCDKKWDYYKFFVEDTGIGIRKEYQEQIFKMFRRLNDVEAEGTGVGLAIVKKIVEEHNGKIWVESPVKDGRGSKFCFTIPT